MHRPVCTGSCLQLGNCDFSLLEKGCIALKWKKLMWFPQCSRAMKRSRFEGSGTKTEGSKRRARVSPVPWLQHALDHSKLRDALTSSCCFGWFQKLEFLEKGYKVLAEICPEILHSLLWRWCSSFLQSHAFFGSVCFHFFQVGGLDTKPEFDVEPSPLLLSARQLSRKVAPLSQQGHGQRAKRRSGGSMWTQVNDPQ